MTVGAWHWFGIGIGEGNVRMVVKLQQRVDHKNLKV
jgi:hypothetical protein